MERRVVEIANGKACLRLFPKILPLHQRCWKNCRLLKSFLSETSFSKVACKCQFNYDPYLFIANSCFAEHHFSTIFYTQMIRPSSQLEMFLREWRRALSVRAPNRGFWEGDIALEDLTQTGYLTRARLEEKSELLGKGIEHRFAQQSITLICNELSRYHESSSLGLDKQKIMIEWLEQQHHKFMNKSVTSNPTFRRELKKIANSINGGVLALQKRTKEWLDPVQSLFGDPFAPPKEFWQQRQLDSLFQIRVAAIFRGHLPANPYPTRARGSRTKPNPKKARGPSLRTIARLVVLFTICAEVAQIKNGEVRLKSNDHAISVSGVYQLLRRAKLDESLI